MAAMTGSAYGSSDSDEASFPDVFGGGEALLARVRAEVAIPDTRQVRFALGYLFVAGLAPVWDAVESGPAREIHLLIGNTAIVPTDEQSIAIGTLLESGEDSAQTTLPPELDVAAAARAQRRRTVEDTAGALRANLRRIAHTEENSRLLLGLGRAVAQNRLRVRIYGDGRLHAKAYLFRRTANASHPSTALVGSTNLTLPVPAGGAATELNVAVRDPGGFATVEQWFDRLWAESQDFSRALVAELFGVWPLAG